MSLALFDLDNTLLDGDSDRLWSQYLFEKGVLNSSLHAERLDEYDRQYHAGELDARDYLSFSLGLLSKVPPSELRRLREDFMQQMITPRISNAARSLLAKHRTAGHTLIIITLTNRFITEPIAAELGVDALLATVPEFAEGRLTGKIVGEPCYQRGKLAHLQTWMQEHGENLDNSYFYSDSLNDLPLLEAVTCPVVVGPDPALTKIANERGWMTLHLAVDDKETSSL